ncbi:hypothetical protein JRO89_XS06G0091300 [Xanthoceras sorbifolium]|uniref:Uncharacterized protein n=1 Tax=Xanthoceras sorbifolium TaxID=99658 RepID=A0ABQ8HXF4_9ROSI|nr:hypothetical protein JRO89_XS06G0091300 [Xanthoceras sorbifolium]
MEPRRRIIFVAPVLFLLSCFYSNLGNAIDTITSSRPIRDHETIISNGSAFKLGFFRPGNSSNRYVGIWYNKESEPVVWVANRNKPLNDASGVVTISDHGNLVVLNGQNEVLWSTNVSNSMTNASAQLLDSGNLVLRNNTNGISIWESFQEPTDTILSGMKVSSNKKTDQKVSLTSWKNPSDPSPGSFSHGIKSSDIPEACIWNESRVYWRPGLWNSQTFIGANGRYSFYNDGFQITVDDQEDAVFFTYTFPNLSMFFVLSSQGILEERDWDEGKKNWKVRYQTLQTECDVYGWCGAFGSCNPQKNPICRCLRGFQPKNIEEWNRGNWTSGCVRKRLLQCERRNLTGEKDRFLKLAKMKLPDFVERSSVPVEICREQCLNNCSCIAYAYDASIGCMTWTESLTDIQKFSSGAVDLYIRLAHSELAKKDNKVLIIIPIVVGIITFAICAFFLHSNRCDNVFTVQAWKLWNENNILALIDPVISNPCFQPEILRCIQVGLLCVQEFVKDRPTMPTVVSMLNSEIVDLPTPKQPAFTESQNALDAKSFVQSKQKCSVNYVTLSVIGGR